MENKHLSFLRSSFEESETIHRKIFHSIKAKADAKRTTLERVADFVVMKFGSINFLAFNIIAFIIWMLINTNKISRIPAFDPFPFNLLTTAVSIEAIILAIFVLISQNRTAKVDDLREETHLQLNLIAEREITKIIKLLALLLEKQGVDLSQDPELKRMVLPVSEEEIERKLEKEIL